MFLAGAEYGGPAYAVQANPAYTQGLVGAAPGVPGPGYPQQGGAPAYPYTGHDNQRNFSG